MLLLDKPLEVSSNGALQRVKRIFGAAKAGHTGTLDPLASGLLPVCFGEATKYSGMMLDADKTYRATLKLGQTTSTGDAEGELLEKREVALDEAGVATALERFRGEIRQVPPMHSALKHKGKPLYAYIRAGVEIERPARDVTIYDLVMERLTDDEMELTVRCSKGTYIRVLAEDIGKALGCGAHLKSLVRTAIGPFFLGDAFAMGEIEQREDRDSMLLPCDALLQSLGTLVVGEVDAQALLNGKIVEGLGTVPGLVRLYDVEKRFLGLGESSECGKIRPKRMMSGNFSGNSRHLLEENTF